MNNQDAMLQMLTNIQTQIQTLGERVARVEQSRRKLEPVRERRTYKAEKEDDSAVVEPKPPDHGQDLYYNNPYQKTSWQLSHQTTPKRVHNGISFDKRDVPRLSTFSGSGDPREYQQWEHNVTEYFRYHTLPRIDRIDHCLRKLVGEAKRWWLKEEEARSYYGEPAIITWEQLKKVMRRRFAPDYKPLGQRPYSRDRKTTLASDVKRDLKGSNEQYKSFKPLEAHETFWYEPNDKNKVKGNTLGCLVTSPPLEHHVQNKSSCMMHLSFPKAIDTGSVSMETQGDMSTNKKQLMKSSKEDEKSLSTKEKLSQKGESVLIHETEESVVELAGLKDKQWDQKRTIKHELHPNLNQVFINIPNDYGSVYILQNTSTTIENVLLISLIKLQEEPPDVVLKLQEVFGTKHSKVEAQHSVTYFADAQRKFEGSPCMQAFLMEPRREKIMSYLLIKKPPEASKFSWSSCQEVLPQLMISQMVSFIALLQLQNSTESVLWIKENPPDPPYQEALRLHGIQVSALDHFIQFNTTSLTMITHLLHPKGNEKFSGSIEKHMEQEDGNDTNLQASDKLSNATREVGRMQAVVQIKEEPPDPYNHANRRHKRKTELGNLTKDGSLLPQNQEHEVITPFQLKEKSPDGPTSRSYQGKILNPYTLQWTNLPSLDVGNKVSWTKPFEEGGDDVATKSTKTSHGPFIQSITHNGREGEQRSHGDLTQAFSRSKLKKPGRTPEDCSASSDLKINSENSETNFDGFLTHFESLSKLNQPIICSDEGVMNFLSQTYSSNPEIDQCALFWVQRTNQKELKCKPTWDGILINNRRFGNWIHTKPRSDGRDIDFTSEPDSYTARLDLHAFFGEPRFSHKESGYKPNCFTIQAHQARSETWNYFKRTSYEELMEFTNHWYLHLPYSGAQDLPYLETKTFKTQDQRLLPYERPRQIRISSHIIPKHSSYGPKLSRLKKIS